MCPKKTKTTSFVWKYFIKSECGGGVCKICHKNIKAMGNTTNLMSHLRHIHPDIIKFEKDDSADKSRPSSSATIDFSEIETVTELELEYDCGDKEITHNINISEQENVRIVAEESEELCSQSSAETFFNSQNHSQITQHFKAISRGSVDSELAMSSKELSLFTPCKPKKVARTQQIDTVFNNISSYNEGGAKASKITNAILYMIAKDNLSLCTTEKEGFRYFIQVIAPLYKVPTRKSITKQIDAKYDVLSSVLKKKIRSINYFTLTTDIWTETMNTQSFLGVTAHFIFENSLCSAMICVAPLDERHSADVISRHLKTICSEWNIEEEKIVAVVSDSASNMSKAINDTFGKEKHLPCFAHSVNLVGQGAISEFPELKNLLLKVKEIVKFFKHSVVAADELRNIQSQTGQPLKLVQEVPTRWNSAYYMLERFHVLKEQVGAVLLRLPKSPDMLTGLELLTIEDTIKILRPLEILTKEICGDKTITSSKVIPLISCMVNQISKIVTETALSKTLKEKLLKHIEKRFQYIEKFQLLAMSTILDPRFKKIHFKDFISCSKAIKTIDKFLKEEVAANSKEIRSEQNKAKDTPRPTGETENSEKFDLWRFHKELVSASSQHKISESQGDGIHPGFSQYLNQPPMDLQIDPLAYWSIHENINPEISKIAQKYLCITATSVPSERLFSRAGNVMEESRNRLLPERLNKLLFLNSLNFKDWLL